MADYTMPIKPKFDEVALTYDQLQPETKRQLEEIYGKGTPPKGFGEFGANKIEGMTFEEWDQKGGVEQFVGSRGIKDLDTWANEARFAEEVYKKETNKDVDWSDEKSSEEFMNWLVRPEHKTQDFNRFLKFNYNDHGQLKDGARGEFHDSILLKLYQANPTEENKRRIFDYLQPTEREEVPAS